MFKIVIENKNYDISNCVKDMLFSKKLSCMMNVLVENIV